MDSDTKANIKEITENTRIALPLKLEISMIVALITLVVLILKAYAGLTEFDRFVEKRLEEKCDKTEFSRHTYIDSLRFNYYAKDIQKDLRQIKKKLNIQEDGND